MKKILKKILRILAITVAVVLFLFFLLAFLLTLSPVQSQVVVWTKDFMEKRLDTRVEVGKVDLELPTNGVLENIVIYDRKNIPAIKVSEVKIDLLAFSVWRYIRYPKQSQNLSVSSVQLINPEVFFYKDASLPDSALNIKFLGGDKKKKKGAGNLALEIEIPNISIVNGAAMVIDSTDLAGDSIFTHRINFKNLNVKNINGELGLHIFPEGRMEVDVKRITATEDHCNFTLNHFESGLVIDTLHVYDGVNDCYTESPYVSFNNLVIDAGNTRLRADLLIEDEEATDLFDKVFDEQFVLDLAGSRLDFATLNYFLPKPVPLEGVMHAQGRISGTFDKISSNNFYARYRDSTRINGRFVLDDMTLGKEVKMDIELEESYLSFEDLSLLLPKVTFPKSLTQLGRLGLEGNYKGKYYDFDIDANIQTAAGNAISHLHITLPPFTKSIGYKGIIQTINLDVDRLGLVNTKLSNRLNVNGFVEGEGLSIEDLNSNINVKFNPSDILGISMDSAFAKVVIKDKNVYGSINFIDPDGAANVTVDLELGAKPAKYVVSGEVNQLNLKTYNIYKKEPLFLTAGVNINLSGDSLENISGTMELVDAILERRGDSTEVFKVPDFKLVSENNTNKNKYISLESTLMDATFEGAFSLKNGIGLAQRLVEETGLYIENNDSISIAYYDRKQAETPEIDSLDIRFMLVTKDSINAVFRYFNQPVYLAPGASLLGKIGSDNDTRMENAILSFKIDSAAYKDFHLTRAELNLQLDKDAYSDFTLLDVGVKSYDAFITDAILLDSLFLDLEVSEGEMNTYLFAYQKQLGNQRGNRLRLISDWTFEDDGRIVTQIDSGRSNLKVGDYIWTFNEDQQITFTKDKVTVSDFKFLSRGQSFVANGEISKEENSELKVDVNELDIGLLNELFPLKYVLDGMMNVQITLGEILASPKIAASGVLDEFALEGYGYGDLRIDSRWDKDNDKIILDARLLNDEIARIKLLGAYKYKDEKSPLDFELITEGTFPLEYVYPFVKSQIYDIDGQVKLDSFFVTGSFNDMVVLGNGELQNAKFGVEYFKTEYSFTGDVKFEKNFISFPRLKLYDRYNESVDFYGLISHRGFKDFEFDLQMEEVKQFLIMDTKKEDNPLFYGKLFIDGGVASITGNLEKLEVFAFAESGANSVLRIPLSDEAELERPGYIKFVGDEDIDSRSVETGLQGFELNLTIHAKPNAQVDLIFDEKVGDIITGRGEGTLNLLINEQGEFSMTGEYVISEGDYLFTARNIVNKKFLVKPGGKITWTGDPYEAKVDLEAAYPLNADIKDLIDVNTTVSVPVNVLMKMKGSLLQPEIGLDIEIENLNDQDVLNVAKYVQTIQYDEQELNKQVFSLMVFKRFAPSGGAAAGFGGAGVTSSISELLSNQLNYWLAKALGDNVTVGVGTDNFQDINLKIAASFFKDRLTIERDGALVSTESNFSLGNFSIILKLLPAVDSSRTQRKSNPSELVLEVFNRENYDISFERTDQTGLGIFFKKDFDTLKELLGIRPKPLKLKSSNP